MKKAIVFHECVETGERDFNGAKLYRTLREAKRIAKDRNGCITYTRTSNNGKVVENWIYKAAYFDIWPVKVN